MSEGGKKTREEKVRLRIALECWNVYTPADLPSDVDCSRIVEAVQDKFGQYTAFIEHGLPLCTVVVRT